MASSAVYQDNPYIIGVPVDDRKSFYGRERLFDYVRDNLSTGSKVVLLSGQRRIGKSSLLRQILNFVALPDFAFIYYDLQASTRVPLGKLLFNIGEEIIKHLNLDRSVVQSLTVEELEANPAEFVSRFLPRVYAAIGGKKLVFLLDEFDVLDGETGGYAAGRFFPFLQSVIDSDPRLYIIPIVGRRLDQISQLPGRFLSAPHQEIKLLDARSTTRLITEPVAGVLEYTPEAIEAILGLTSGHPYFTQLVCFSAFQRARDEDQWTVSGEDIKAVTPDAIVSGQGGLTWFRDGLPLEERVVFSAIAELKENHAAARLHATTPMKRSGGVVLDLLSTYGVVPTERLVAAEQKLLDWGFVKEAEEQGGLYSRTVTVELVRRWLTQQYPLRHEIFELEKSTPSAQSEYESGVQAATQGDLPAAVKFCKRALELNPNHLHAVGELAVVLLDLDEYAQAVEYYTRAYQADPVQHKDGFARALLGHARDLIRDGEFEQAHTEVTRALDLSPGNPRALQRVAEAEAGMRRVLSVQNPFFVGNGIPPERFVGRSEAVSKLLASMAQSGNIAIYGETGMGKTALLQYVSSSDVLKAHHLDPAQTIAIYLNCQSLAPFSPQRLWDFVLQELEKRAPTPGLIKLKTEKKDPLALISALQEFAETGKHAVLLLDEFETALQPHTEYSETGVLDFMRAIRGIVVSGRGLTLAVATRRSLLQIGPKTGQGESPLFNAFVFSPLLPFTNPEVEELAAKMPSAVGPLSDAEKEWLFEVSGGYPFVVQLALSILFRYHANGSPFELKAAMQELAAAVDAPFSALWSGLAADEQDFLVIVATYNLKSRVPGRVRFGLLGGIGREQMMLELQSRGLISRDVFRVSSSILEWWILQRVETLGGNETEQLIVRLETPQGSTDGLFQKALSAIGFGNRIRDSIMEVWNKKLANKSIELWGRPVAKPQSKEGST